MTPLFKSRPNKISWSPPSGLTMGPKTKRKKEKKYSVNTKKQNKSEGGFSKDNGFIFKEGAIG
jgi:hypothetical protein